MNQEYSLYPISFYYSYDSVVNLPLIQQPDLININREGLSQSSEEDSKTFKWNYIFKELGETVNEISQTHFSSFFYNLMSIKEYEI